MCSVLKLETFLAHFCFLCAVLITKQGCQGKPDQYYPITCLNTAYKLLTAVLTEIIADRVWDIDVILRVQKALRKKRRGCLDALLIDGTVAREAKDERHTLSVGWIDYQKAYDHVSHGWLDQVLCTTGVPEKVGHCIRNLRQQWQSAFSLWRGKDAVWVNLTFKQGLFQGESLSPLHSTHKPLSEGVWESWVTSDKVGHQFFMDDLKVYMENPTDLKSALTLVDCVSKAVGMELGLRKCGVAHLKWLSTVIHEGEVGVPDQHIIDTVIEAYKYLGIDQLIEPRHDNMKEQLKERYVKRLHQV